MTTTFRALGGVDLAGESWSLDTVQASRRGFACREKTDTMLRKRFEPSAVLGERLVNRRLSVSSGVSDADIRPYMGIASHGSSLSQISYSIPLKSLEIPQKQS
jgi:hypothetical protein